MNPSEVERQSLEVDIACVGFGPAMGGFLTTLSRSLLNEDGSPALESRVMPGMPLQVVCYERADDLGFGVSGVVTRARAIRGTFPELPFDEIPLSCPVTHEKVAYLLDPIGASRRPADVRALDRLARISGAKNHARELPYIPPFLAKHDGVLLSLGQFVQWVGSQLMMSGTVQLWPATPVSEPLIEEGKVAGVRLADQGVEPSGEPTPSYMPGMDVRAALTVVGDGPIGPVGRKLDQAFGLPEDHHQRHWAVGMKVVVDLPERCSLEPGTVIHTFGYPEPEIFGFLYVYPGRVAAAGIFVPSFLESPIRTSYRYLQHWMQHPYLWQHLEGGTMRSWGAKTLQESGRIGEPKLVGDGFARIGEGSGSTNVLTGSGVDEAWMTGVLLAEGVVELVKEGKEFSEAELEQAYVRRRRGSWLDEESKIAEHARDGFTKGFVRGLMGMGIAGFSKGKLHAQARDERTNARVPSLEEYFRDRVAADEIERIKRDCMKKGLPLHDALMEAAGWPAIEHDGRLLVSHQDALLLGGKVQAPAGYADHIVFVYPSLCEGCHNKLCIEVCSGQAITPNPDSGVPRFDREKCVHCGACVWSCPVPNPDDPERSNVEFRAAAGGLHSVEN